MRVGRSGRRRGQTGQSPGCSSSVSARSSARLILGATTCSPNHTAARNTMTAPAKTTNSVAIVPGSAASTKSIAGKDCIGEDGAVRVLEIRSRTWSSSSMSNDRRAAAGAGAGLSLGRTPPRSGSDSRSTDPPWSRLVVGLIPRSRAGRTVETPSCPRPTASAPCALGGFVQFGVASLVAAPRGPLLDANPWLISDRRRWLGTRRGRPGFGGEIRH